MKPKAKIKEVKAYQTSDGHLFLKREEAKKFEKGRRLRERIREIDLVGTDDICWDDRRNEGSLFLLDQNR